MYYVKFFVIICVGLVKSDEEIWKILLELLFKFELNSI